MGVQFGDLVEPRKIALEELKGRTIAFDSHNVAYQFLSIIRGQARARLCAKNRRGIALVRQ